MKVAVLSSNEKRNISTIYFTIFAVTTLGVVVSLIVGKLYLVLAGLGVVAYVFGLRHGVDADHIAAIDNTTRKLIQEGKRPWTVGLWFSLGHSTVVVGLILAFVVATRAIAGSIPMLQSAGALVGSGFSGIFLWIIGLINVVVVAEVFKIFRGLREGKLDESKLENLLENRGFMNRHFKSMFRLIKQPWQIYPMGLLFGLGFDTASEIALIAMSVGVGVSSSVPIWMILLLPLMFTCGMVLVDTSDGVAMRVAYGWAFLKPLRKIYYNLTVTIISVLIAFMIGSVELLQVLSGELNLTGPFWNWLDALDFETLGFAVIGIFVITWLCSVLFWKYKRYEEVHRVRLSSLAERLLHLFAFKISWRRPSVRNSDSPSTTRP